MNKAKTLPGWHTNQRIGDFGFEKEPRLGPKTLAKKQVSIPAPDIPMERGKDHLHFKSTAEHETRHALVAITLGAKINRITVEPEGDVLGSVSLVGDHNTATFQVIAMASSVDAHPHGTGSDRYKADIMQHTSGGIAADQAFRMASSIISNHSEEFWDRLSELLAYRKNTGAEDFKALIKRVEWDITKGKIITEPEDKLEIDENHTQPEDGHKTTMIESLADGNTRINKLYDGKLMETHIMCGHCKATDAHLQTCRTTIMQETSRGQTDKLDQSYMKSTLPQTDVIFSSEMVASE